MGRVRTDPKYIGSALRNDVEVGDEVCVYFEDGTYMNREVTEVREMTSTGGEVTIGDPTEDQHAILSWRINESADGLGGRDDWEAFAFRLDEEADNHAVDHGDIEAFYIVGEGLRSPDMTFEEAVETRDDAKDFREPAEMKEHIGRIQTAAMKLMYDIDLLEQGDITMAEFEQRLDTLQVRHGGRLPFDGHPG